VSDPKLDRAEWQARWTLRRKAGRDQSARVKLGKATMASYLLHTGMYLLYSPDANSRP
jgi:hypothetical protein